MLACISWAAFRAGGHHYIAGVYGLCASPNDKGAENDDSHRKRRAKSEILFYIYIRLYKSLYLIYKYFYFLI